MHKHLILFSIIFFSLTFSLHAQSSVSFVGISQTNINLEGGPVVLGQTTINATENGKVIVRFDGKAVVSPGDRIVLAASDQPDWGVNDGNIGLEVPNSDQNRHSFSHTRVYDVTAGSHTFYAVGENYVEYDGTGMASIYASLTVEYFPASSGVIIMHQGISQTGIAVEGAPVVMGQLSLNAPMRGTVMVRFDGDAYADVGDRIVLAASDHPDWAVNDGNVGVEAYDGDINHAPFSHSRSYDIAAGMHDFYAIAENYVETMGNGMTSIYASLTVVYVPSDYYPFQYHEGISITGQNVEGAPVSLQNIDIEVPVAGKVLVCFEGVAYADIDDRIVLAASDQIDWGVNDGNVGVEAIDNDLNYQGFSHSRVYDVLPGSYTYHAVAENYVETGGNGETSVYGSLSVRYFPFASTDIDDPIRMDEQVHVYPNPASDQVEVQWSADPGKDFQVELWDMSGKMIYRQHVGGLNNVQLNLTDQSPGMYLIKVYDQEAIGVKPLIKR